MYNVIPNTLPPFTRNLTNSMCTVYFHFISSKGGYAQDWYYCFIMDGFDMTENPSYFNKLL